MSRAKHHGLPQMIFMFLVIMTGNVCMAQDNLTDIFLRKAVKEFVAKQYDRAINDLDQALTADPDNGKAKKLLAKCRERKASQSLLTGDIENARNGFMLALESDSGNVEAKTGLARIEAINSGHTADPLEKTRSRAVKDEQPPHATTQQSPIIINTPQPNLKADSTQAELIALIMANFQQQQKIMAQQLTSGNELMKATDSQKERYLEALIKASEQKSGMMREFIIVGAAVVLGTILIALFVFIFIFGKYSRVSELRTIQATEALQALIANRDVKQLASTESQLLLSGPSAKTGDSGTTPSSDGTIVKDAIVGITLEALSDSDPGTRAKNIELFESELSNGGINKPDSAPKIAKLKELLNDSNNRVRANAAKAFYLVNPDLALSNLREMLGKESSRSRASALWSLGEIGSKKALDMILAMTEEDDEIVCYNIKMALQKIFSRKTCDIDYTMSKRMTTLIQQYSEAA